MEQHAVYDLGSLSSISLWWQQMMEAFSQCLFFLSLMQIRTFKLRNCVCVPEALCTCIYLLIGREKVCFQQSSEGCWVCDADLRLPSQSKQHHWPLDGTKLYCLV